MSLSEFLARHTIDAAPELFTAKDDKAVRCQACANRCYIPEGDSGYCRVRLNRDGRLRVPGGYVAGLQVDPIEKKPFFHVLPGREALSFGMLGCDLHCEFCQNWVSSQALRDEAAGSGITEISPEKIIALALHQGAPVVVSTYNEPLITTEWAVRIFERAREHGLLCGYVSNGNATPEVLEYLRPHMQLFKVDLKTFSEEGYRRLGTTRKNVTDTIERLKAMGFWVEVVTLVVPGFNDGDDELREIARFIAGVSPDIPWHVTAFHPDYKMVDARRTAPHDLERARAAGLDAGLRFVYSGNLPGAVGGGEDTRCPSCGELLIERRGYHILRNALTAGRCPQCAAEIPGVWEHPVPRKDTDARAPRRVLP